MQSLSSTTLPSVPNHQFQLHTSANAAAASTSLIVSHTSTVIKSTVSGGDHSIRQGGATSYVQPRAACVSNPFSLTTAPYRDAVTPRVDYLNAKCMLLTYSDADISCLLEQHFARSLSAGSSLKAKAKKVTNFPASFWNRHYNSTPNVRSQQVAQQTAAIPAHLGMNLSAFPGAQYSADPYSLLRQTPAMWSSYPQAAGPSSGTTDMYSGLQGHSRSVSSYSSLFGFSPSEQSRIAAVSKLNPPSLHPSPQFKPDWTTGYADQFGAVPQALQKSAYAFSGFDPSSMQLEPHKDLYWF